MTSNIASPLGPPWPPGGSNACNGAHNDARDDAAPDEVASDAAGGDGASDEGRPASATPASATPTEYAPGTPAEEARKLAVRTAEMLRGELRALSREPADDPARAKGYSETRTKALLAITKGILSLEDLIRRMDSAIDEHHRYPSDVMAFRRKLERQIQAIADKGGAA